ncbi:MAG TPA: secondary thiamine-phosphate synthase enzyme YjbQ [Bacteroidales bacterium]
MIIQKEIETGPFKKGFHNINTLIVKEFGEFPENGLLNIFVKHTSAGLMINENADPDVLTDLNSLLDRIAPENAPFYHHTMEGPDDMPAHFKSAILGHSLTIPVTNHRLNLGMWQCVYFCEFRNRGGKRKIVLTLYY